MLQSNANANAYAATYADSDPATYADPYTDSNAYAQPNQRRRGRRLLLRMLRGWMLVIDNLILNAERLAIVGNGPTQIGKGTGAEIDSADLVIRFNNYETLPERTVDYGSRCDIWCSNLLPITKARPEFEGLTVCSRCFNDEKWEWGYKKGDVSVCQPERIDVCDDLEVIPADVYGSLLKYWIADCIVTGRVDFSATIHGYTIPWWIAKPDGKRRRNIQQPTTGLSMLWWIHEIKGYVDPDWLYGWGWYREDKPYYYSQKMSEGGHAAMKWQGLREERIFNQYFNTENQRDLETNSE